MVCRRNCSANPLTLSPQVPPLRRRMCVGGGGLGGGGEGVSPNSYLSSVVRCSLSVVLGPWSLVLRRWPIQSVPRVRPSPLAFQGSCGCRFGGELGFQAAQTSA